MKESETKSINKNPQSFLEIRSLLEINNPSSIISYSLQTFKNTMWENDQQTSLEMLNNYCAVFLQFINTISSGIGRTTY